jgi:hypothetical protein
VPELEERGKEGTGGEEWREREQRPKRDDRRDTTRNRTDTDGARAWRSAVTLLDRLVGMEVRDNTWDT